jgi:hypothetical protein
MSGANPASSTPFTNVLTAKNVVKAWGVFTAGISGAVPFVTLLDGFNVATLVHNGTYISVAIADNLSSTSYAVVVTGGTSTYTNPGVITAQTFFNALISSAGTFDITGMSVDQSFPSAWLSIDFGAYDPASYTISFVVYGAQ